MNKISEKFLLSLATHFAHSMQMKGCGHNSRWVCKHCKESDTILEEFEHKDDCIVEPAISFLIESGNKSILDDVWICRESRLNDSEIIDKE